MNRLTTILAFLVIMLAAEAAMSQVIVSDGVEYHSAGTRSEEEQQSDREIARHTAVLLEGSDESVEPSQELLQKIYDAACFFSNKPDFALSVFSMKLAQGLADDRLYWDTDELDRMIDGLYSRFPDNPSALILFLGYRASARQDNLLDIIRDYFKRNGCREKDLQLLSMFRDSFYMYSMARLSMDKLKEKKGRLDALNHDFTLFLDGIKSVTDSDDPVVKDVTAELQLLDFAFRGCLKENNQLFTNEEIEAWRKRVSHAVQNSYQRIDKHESFVINLKLISGIIIAAHQGNLLEVLLNEIQGMIDVSIQTDDMKDFLSELRLVSAMLRNDLVVLKEYFARVANIEDKEATGIMMKCLIHSMDLTMEFGDRYFDLAEAMYTFYVRERPEYAEQVKQLLDQRISQGRTIFSPDVSIDNPGEFNLQFLIFAEAISTWRSLNLQLHAMMTKKRIPIIVKPEQPAPDFFNLFAGLLECMGNTDGALDVLHLGLQLYPDNPSMLNGYGYISADHDRELERCGEMLERAVLLELDNYAYRDSIAWCYYKLGRCTSAWHEICQAFWLKLLSNSFLDPTIIQHLKIIFNAYQDELKKKNHYLNP